jgi:hypothetical protein
MRATDKRYINLYLCRFLNIFYYLFHLEFHYLIQMKQFKVRSVRETIKEGLDLPAHAVSGVNVSHIGRVT